MPFLDNLSNTSIIPIALVIIVGLVVIAVIVGRELSRHLQHSKSRAGDITDDKKYKDFHIRRHSPTNGEMAGVFLVLLFIGLIAIILGSDKLILALCLIVLVAACAAYAILQVHRARKMLETSNFESALFSSAIAKGCEFVLIAERAEGKIYYANSSLKKIFGQVASGTLLDEWLRDRAPEMEADRLTGAVAQGAETEVKITLTSRDRKRFGCMLLIEPIARPAGFMLVRCSQMTQL